MELKEGLLVASAVLPRRHENLPVRLLNTTSKEIFFPRGSEVARATPVIVEEASEIEPEGDAFAHVDPLVEGVDSRSAEEKDQLKRVLHEYADVFSRSEFDLGCTDLAITQ